MSSGRRLYLGRLAPDVQRRDIEDLFRGYGTIVDLRVMQGFGFVEFDSSRDADDVLRHFHGRDFMGAQLIVEPAKDPRPRDSGGYGGGDRYVPGGAYGGGDRYGGGGGYGGPPPPRRGGGGYRVFVKGINRETSWQDLKDFGREGGHVLFADVDRDHPGQGILEFGSRADAEDAAKVLDGKELRGTIVQVVEDDRTAGGRDEGYSRRDRDDYGSSRRDRSRSPLRMGSSRRDEYDDRRSSRRDDRDRDYDRDRDSRRDDRDRRSDDRDRRDDRDDRRRDDRPVDDRDDDRREEKRDDGGWN